MSEVSIVIPIGPDHKTIAETAIASVQAQTVSTLAIPIYDEEGRGPAYARNRGLELVQSRYVAFLDADDWIERDFTEQMLARIAPGHYAYSDWWESTGAKTAPEKPWCHQTWHPITTLLPTRLAKHIGGFDEGLAGAEDTDFYLKIVTLRQCGIRVPLPLVHYADSGDSRSKTFRSGPAYDLTMQEIGRRYTGQMGCCGDIEIENLPAGEKQPGDVLVQALWGGNMKKTGRATGRHYARTGNKKTTWVDPRDAAISPDLYAIVVDTDIAVNDPTVFGAAGIAGAVMPVWTQPLAIGIARTSDVVGAEPIQLPELQARPDIRGLLNKVNR